MVKLQFVKGRYYLTIPKMLVERKSWKKGQELFLAFNEKGRIEVIE